MSNHPRINYTQLAPEPFRALVALNRSLVDGRLDQRLAELVRLRVSQINGCAYCLDMHTGALRKDGEDQRRLDTLAAWRENRLFDARECAALGWAESLTRVDRSGAADADYAPLEEHFDEVEIAELSFVIAEINAWNRMAVGLRTPLP